MNKLEQITHNAKGKTIVFRPVTHYDGDDVAFIPNCEIKGFTNLSLDEWDRDVLKWDAAQIGLLFEHFVTLLDKNEGIIVSDVDFLDYSSSSGCILENIRPTGKSKELIDNLED